MRRGGMGRWIWVAIGLAVLGGGLSGAAEPYRQTVEFRRITACDGTAGGCPEREPGSVVDVRTWTGTSTGSNGGSHTETHYEVTWRRSDGSTQTRGVSRGFYAAARQGEPATLRLQSGQVVGVEVAGAAEWWFPQGGAHLVLWLMLVSLGVGITLWALLPDDGDGMHSMLRALAWLGLATLLASGTLSDADPACFVLAAALVVLALPTSRHS